MMVCCSSKRIERAVLIEFLNCGIISSLYIAGKLLITEGDGLATVMVVQFQQHQLP
jgi:hypothetical protein